MKPFALILFLLLSNNIVAQPGEKEQIDAMKKLDWLVGEWTGTAWTQMGPNNRDTVDMHETITKELDGTVLKIRGVGYQENEAGEKVVAHNAMAIISYDAINKKYRWHSWRTPGGWYSELEPEVFENGFTWIMETPQGKMRYTPRLNEKGQWHEIGKFSRDGENWFPFFEMLLDKKK